MLFAVLLIGEPHIVNDSVGGQVVCVQRSRPIVFDVGTLHN